MANNPPDNEVPQLRRLQEWWLQLPLSYRVNALLYLLGACAFVFLVSAVVGGGDGEPRQVQVGAGAVQSTTSTVRPRPSSTLGGSSLNIVTTSSVLATSSTSPTTSGGGSTSPTTGGIGGTQPTSPTVTSPPPTQPQPTTPQITAPPPTASTTAPPTTAPPCRNSQDPRCGVFVWDPPAEQNQPLNVTVVQTPLNPRVGDVVTFSVAADDPDHTVNANCSEVRFGDGETANGPCTQPPPCPEHYGPWGPPARQNGHFTMSFTHVYQGAATFPARFTFKSWGATCLAMDPYASVGESQVNVSIAP